MRSIATKLLAPAAAALLLASGGDELALQRALDTVRHDAVAADVRFLADVELGGRATPSPGLRHAARYVATRLARLGLEPGGDGGFLESYRLERRRVDRDASWALLDAGARQRQLVLGRHYYFDRPARVELAAEVVFAGAGTPAELAAADLRGHWALVLEDGVSWRAVRGQARAAGAAGLIVASEKHEVDRYGQERAAQRVELLDRGRLALAAEDERAFPVVFLEREQARLLVGSGLVLPGTRLGRFQEHRELAPPLEVVEAENVAAYLRGKDSFLRREVVVLSAHLDHLGSLGGHVHPGADDNASGVAALLAAAEALVAHGGVKRTVLFLFPSGSEEGRLGAEAWARDPRLPRGCKVVANLNLDGVGRNAHEVLRVAASPAPVALARRAGELAPLEGFHELGPAGELAERFDHVELARRLRVPAATLTSGPHADYHQPGDTADRVDAAKVARVARLVVRVVLGME